MATQSNQIDIFQGDSKHTAFRIVGVADVSGFIPYLTVKRNSDVILNKALYWTDASGSGVIDWSTIDTSINAREYTYGIWIQDELEVITAITGTLSIRARVRP